MSIINRIAESEASRVALTNKEDKNNETLIRYEDIKSEIYESDFEDLDGSDTNNGNESDSLQLEFMKEEIDLRNEVANHDLQYRSQTNFENDEDTKFDMKIPLINSSEGNANSGNVYKKEELQMKQEASSEHEELETVRNEFGDVLSVACEIANVYTIVNMQDSRHQGFSSEDAKGGKKLPSKSCKSTLTAAIDAHANRLHVQGYHNRRSSKSVQSGAHNRGHSDVEAHTCTVCNKSFRTRRSLTGHGRTHDDDRPYKCIVCNKTFRRLFNLTRHELIHKGARPYKYTVCNKTFTQSGDLTRHERIHSCVRPYKCTVCDKPFTDLGNLTVHERIHSGARPYKCTACDKTFRHLGDLARHERIHSGARPYKCTVCNKTFTDLGSLVKHERIHSGVRPYKLTVCNKTFTKSGRLTKHERIHSGARPYKCTVCNKTFTASDQLTKHERLHSGATNHKRDNATTDKD